MLQLGECSSAVNEVFLWLLEEMAQLHTGDLPLGKKNPCD
jgi:hypothetical protein